MNPRAVVLMWLLTLITLCVLVVAPSSVWIPLTISGLYVVYALIPARG